MEKINFLLSFILVTTYFFGFSSETFYKLKLQRNKFVVTSEMKSSLLNGEIQNLTYQRVRPKILTDCGSICARCKYCKETNTINYEVIKTLKCSN